MLSINISEQDAREIVSKAPPIDSPMYKGMGIAQVALLGALKEALEDLDEPNGSDPGEWYEAEHM